VSPLLASKYKHTNISEGLWTACLKKPSKIANKHGKNTRTYSELTQRIDSISSLNSSFGILSKTKIAMGASNSIEDREIVLAASQGGHPIATVNPKLTIKEMVSICEDAQASLNFVDQKGSIWLEGIQNDGAQRKINIENE
jgi:Acyl-CoA synthetases (AMP-forming)/AMP-acid ligases II